MISSTRSQLGRVLLFCFLAYAILLSYSLARPAIESLYLQDYSSRALPWVWLVEMVAIGAAVAAYLRVAARIPVLVLLGGSALVAVALLALLLSARAFALPGTTFVLYVWKDVYIVVLVEAFWSLANCFFAIRTARWMYGLFLVAGSLGSITGNLGGGRLAMRFGTGTSLFLILPLLTGLGLGCIAAAKRTSLGRAAGGPSPGAGEPAGQQKVSAREGVRIIRQSAYLHLLLLVVALVQIAITLIDYRFNQVLEHTYPLTDVRTAAIGKVYATVESVSLVLQLGSGPLLRLLGVPLTLLAIPLVLATMLGQSAVQVTYGIASRLKIASKCLDYSLFRAAKEILYIPLSYAEKVQGKAVIDMFVYRMAKGPASALLLALSTKQGERMSLYLAMAAVGAWWGLTFIIVRRSRPLLAAAAKSDAA